MSETTSRLLPVLEILPGCLEGRHRILAGYILGFLDHSSHEILRHPPSDNSYFRQYSAGIYDRSATYVLAEGVKPKPVLAEKLHAFGNRSRAGIDFEVKQNDTARSVRMTLVRRGDIDTVEMQLEQPELYVHGAANLVATQPSNADYGIFLEQVQDFAEKGEFRLQLPKRISS